MGLKEAWGGQGGSGSWMWLLSPGKEGRGVEGGAQGALGALDQGQAALN